LSPPAFYFASQCKRAEAGSTCPVEGGHIYCLSGLVKAVLDLQISLWPKGTALMSTAVVGHRTCTREKWVSTSALEKCNYHPLGCHICRRPSFIAV